MSVRHWAQKASRSLYLTADVSAWIAYAALAVITLVVFVDVFGRYVFRHPIAGAYDLVEQSMGAMAAFGIMYAAIKRAHIALDLITKKLPRRFQMILHSAYSLIGFGTWAVAAYEVYVIRLAPAIRVSETTASILRLSVVPVLVMLVVGPLLCSLVLLEQAFHPEVSETSEEARVDES